MAKEKTEFSLVEAVDTLAQIAELEWVPQEPFHEEALEEETLSLHVPSAVEWLVEEDPKVSSQRIKGVFQTILHYLQSYYDEEYVYHADVTSLDRIKNIMVIVGEAAKKLDKYTHLFKNTRSQSVTATKEYRELQKFYQQKIAHPIDEKTLSHWIFGLTQRREPKNVLTPKEMQHVFIDLDAVKRDIEYELLFLKKEDGSRFLRPRLLRNMTLVCDFGTQLREIRGQDPLADTSFWYDMLCHEAAKNILQTCGGMVDDFFHETNTHRHRESVFLINKAIISLMMSAHSENLVENTPAKSCSSYFFDFQVALRNVLHSADYQRWIAYPPKPEENLGRILLDTVHELCRTFFLCIHANQKWMPQLQEILQQARKEWSSEHEEMVEEKPTLWKDMAAQYAAMQKQMRYHPHGPLYKALESIEQIPHLYFDPLLQHNLPNTLYDIYIDGKRIVNIRLPCPIWQEWVHQAHIVDEFRGLLRSYGEELGPGHHLLVNLQDHTSWREHARSSAIQHMANNESFEKVLSIVTLATDTDFVKQRFPYDTENHTSIFMEEFVEQMCSEQSGYIFSPKIREALFPEFVPAVMEAIHRIFFSGKNVLSAEQRRQFIDIVHLFLILKIIDIVQPTSMSCTCKDGIDIGPCYSTLLYAFFQILHREKLTKKERECIARMVYAAPLTIRERLLLPEWFDRLVGAIKTIEQTRIHMGKEAFTTLMQEGFQIFFTTPILEAQLNA